MKNSKEILVCAIRQVQEVVASTGADRVLEDMHLNVIDVKVPGGVVGVLYSMVEVAADGGGQADPVARGGGDVAALINRLVASLCDS